MSVPVARLIALMFAMTSAMAAGAAHAAGPCDSTLTACQAVGFRIESDLPVLSGQGRPAGAQYTEVKAKAPRADAPNIVLVLVDDFSMNLMTSDQGILSQSMPNLAQLITEGASFSHYFVTDSLCCPSRASIFTGLLPHNSKVFSNVPPTGGYEGFMAHGDDGKTFALPLHASGYQTAMMGKFLNGYHPKVDSAPQGWSEWAVGGNAYANFDYVLNHNGMLISSPLHLTDELSKLGQDYIAAHAHEPFLLEIASFSPHKPYVPPKRYASSFSDLTYPKSPAYGASPDAAAPQWLAEIPPLDAPTERRMAESFRDRVRSDKGVDDMIGALRKTLTELGLSQNTYFIFTSDNGYHMGEYGLRPGKMTPFDIDIHVPLVIVGPGIAAGRVIDQTAMNIDFYPTFAEWSGSPANPGVDGHSLAGLLQGKAENWRNLAVVEHKHDKGDSPTDPDLPEPKSGNPPDYTALRLPDALYVEYHDTIGEIGYYDLRADPDALHNIANSLSAERKQALHAAILANAACQGQTQCWSAQSLTP